LGGAARSRPDGRKLFGRSLNVCSGSIFDIPGKVKDLFGRGKHSAKTQGKRPQGTELRFLRM
jgi:hypothetical protein